jgi:hypothetical protein
MYTSVAAEIARKFRNAHVLNDDQHVKEWRVSSTEGASMPQNHLLDQHMTSLFPELDSVLRTGQPTPSRIEKQAGLDYFAHISVWNQLLTMSKQLNYDGTHATNHKYIAHQIALLYQCLNHSRGEFKPFKREIEKHFDSIKALTESCSVPMLRADQKEWLHGVTTGITELLTSFPQSMQEQVKPIKSILS